MIVPSIPEKNAIGRFKEEFIENRRFKLQRFILRISQHEILRNDDDFKCFLNSSNLQEEISKRSTSSKGLGRLFDNFSFNFGNIFGHKELDESIEIKKGRMLELENQLKALTKTIEGMVKQRKEMGQACTKFGESLLSLSTVETNPSLTTALRQIGSVQKKIKEIHDHQAKQEVILLLHTAEEYIRNTGSIKIAYNTRLRSLLNWKNQEVELKKKKDQLLKWKSQPQKTSADKIADLQKDILRDEVEAEVLKNCFEEIHGIFVNELTNFDLIKIQDFKVTIEQFLMNMIQSQHQIIELWQSLLKSEPFCEVSTNSPPIN